MNQKNRLRHGLITFCLAAMSANSGSLLAQETNTTAPQAQPEACSYDKSTPIIPDGNVATEDELIAAQTRIKAFQGRLETFRNCLIAKEKQLDVESDTYEAMSAELVAQRNESISLEEQVADEFNGAIKLYKAK